VKSKLWWTGQCLLVLAAAFFLAYGISLFRAAYKLNDPFYFIMMIFASNLIILINGTLLIGIVYRMISVYKLLKKQPKR
jgi:ABC-type antimicrobial peptide transport system permease subunit